MIYKAIYANNVFSFSKLSLFCAHPLQKMLHYQDECSIMSRKVLRFTVPTLPLVLLSNPPIWFPDTSSIILFKSSVDNNTCQRSTPNSSENYQCTKGEFPIRQILVPRILHIHVPACRMWWDHHSCCRCRLACWGWNRQSVPPHTGRSHPSHLSQVH